MPYFRTNGGARMSREGRGMGSFNEVMHGSRPRRPTWDEKVAEARRLVPGEHPPFAAMAVQVLRFGGHSVTADSVREKLRSEGRDMKSLLAKAAAEERANEGAA